MTRNSDRARTIAIPLNPAFDPTGLRDAAGNCDDAVRPWTWLADPATTDDERAEHRRRFVRGHGTVDPSDRDLTLEARSRRSVISGYLRQQVFLDLPGEPGLRLRLDLSESGTDAMDADPAPERGAALPTDDVDPRKSTAADASRAVSAPGAARAMDEGSSDAADPTHPEPAVAGSASAIPAGFPFSGPIALIGTTAPAIVAPVAVGRHLAEELADFLAGRGIRSMPALAADPQREWLDELVIAEYPDAEASLVRTAAHSHLQPFLTVWRPEPGTEHGILEIVGVANPVDGEVVARGVARLHRVAYRPCPMIPDAECGDLCRMHGGPWVSRSITAASRWESRRARMIRALGCDACGDGAITIFAGAVHGGRRMAIPIRPDVATPTRHDRLVAASTGTGEQTS